MGIAYHTLYTPDGAGTNLFDRITLGTVTAVYPAATATGALTTIAVSWTEPVPTPYTVLMSPVEDCTYFITSKTTVGFTLNLNSRLLTGTLTGASVECFILS